MAPMIKNVLFMNSVLNCSFYINVNVNIAPNGLAKFRGRFQKSNLINAPNKQAE
jgi:hypothetical protein